MFISVKNLNENLGVNSTIGKFFVDREPPKNNSFWKGKLLYISFGNGFVNIPVYHDILYRLGLPMDLLLSEDVIGFMERLMHYATLHENIEMTFDKHLTEIQSLIEDKIVHFDLFNNLNKYLAQPIMKPRGNLGLPIPALNRGDAYLYMLCILPMSGEQLELALKFWYKLLPSFLILDDIDDYYSDIENGEENCISDLGGGEQGFEKAFVMLQENASFLREINELLSQHLINLLESVKNKINKPV